MKPTEKPPRNESLKPLVVNRKARHQYIILDRIEAGIVLLGTEVKAIRDGQVDLSAGYARIENDRAILYEVHIKPYEYGHQFNHPPRRPRQLLLHRHEIKKLSNKVAPKGRTLVPLELHSNRRGKMKVILGLCQGKHMADRRETLRRKTAERDTARAIAARSKKAF